jgi:Fe2+ transport system protein FeoA
MKVQLNDIRKKSTWEGKEPEHHSPALNYCRKLLKEGINPSERLDVYRGEQLAYSVTSIGEGAKWKVHEDEKSGPHFKKYKANPGWHLKGAEKAVPTNSLVSLNEKDIPR